MGDVLHRIRSQYPRQGYGALFLLCVVGIAGIFLLWPGGEDGGWREERVAAVVAACEDARHRPTCYEREVPKLLSEISMEETFAVVRGIQAADAAYRFCHVLAHELGGLEVAKDPQNWFDVIPRCPTDGLCSNGCVHGAAVERFSTEVLSDEEIEGVIPDLARACEAREGFSPTPLDQAMCYHGIGHMSVHITASRIDTALDICDRVAVKEDGRDYTRLCDEGVFMQLFQPLEPEDFALVDLLPMTPTKENLASFCSMYGTTPEEEASCWREGWPFYREEIHTPEGLVAFCGVSAGEQATQRCYETTLSIVGRGSLASPETTRALCAALPEARQSLCFSIMAGTILEEDRARGADAAGYCAAVPTLREQRACYDRLEGIATFVFHPSDARLKTLCDALPSPWSERCFAKIDA
jgi:hypothetical protein